MEVRFWIEERGNVLQIQNYQDNLFLGKTGYENLFICQSILSRLNLVGYGKSGSSQPENCFFSDKSKMKSVESTYA